LRKTLFKILAAMMLVALFWASIGESFHHHPNLESEDDCGYCHWNLTSSNAVVSAAVTQLFPLFFVLSFFFPEAIVVFRKTLCAQGRAPPVSLV